MRRLKAVKAPFGSGDGSRILVKARPGKYATGETVKVVYSDGVVRGMVTREIPQIRPHWFTQVPFSEFEIQVRPESEDGGKTVCICRGFDPHPECVAFHAEFVDSWGDET